MPGLGGMQFGRANNGNKVRVLVTDVGVNEDGEEVANVTGYAIRFACKHEEITLYDGNDLQEMVEQATHTAVSRQWCNTCLAQLQGNASV